MDNGDKLLILTMCFCILLGLVATLIFNNDQNKKTSFCEEKGYDKADFSLNKCYNIYLNEEGMIVRLYSEGEIS